MVLQQVVLETLQRLVQQPYHAAGAASLLLGARVHADGSESAQLHPQWLGRGSMTGCISAFTGKGGSWGGSPLLGRREAA